MKKMEFNDWMLHIYTQLNYPQQTLKLYEQGKRNDENIQIHKRYLKEAGQDEYGGEKGIYRILGTN